MLTNSNVNINTYVRFHRLRKVKNERGTSTSTSTTTCNHPSIILLVRTYIFQPIYTAYKILTVSTDTSTLVQ